MSINTPVSTLRQQNYDDWEFDPIARMAPLSAFRSRFHGFSWLW